MFTFAPVAISALSNPISSPPCSFAVRASTSSDNTFVPVRSSTPFSSYQETGLTWASSLVASPRRYSLVSGGRSYGGSLSRPTSTIFPSAPPLRSSAAQYPAANPPISRKSVRSGTVRPEEDLQLFLQPRIEDGQHLVARLQDGVGGRHETSLPLTKNRNQQAALRHVEITNTHTRNAAVLTQHHLDDLQPFLGQIEQVHEPVLGHLVLQQPQDQVCRRDVGLDPQQLEVRPVPGVVDPRDDPVDQVLLLRHLADQHVVLVVAGHRDHQVGARDPGALQNPELRRIPVLDVVLELLLDGQVAVPVVLDHGHLVSLVEQLPGQVPPHLPGPGDDDVFPLSHRSAGYLVPAASRTSASSISIATLVGQTVFTPCFAYHSARSGSRIRATTVGTLKRRFAICEMTILVLSPSVEAMKASARSIPPAISASSSRPVPTVN